MSRPSVHLDDARRADRHDHFLRCVVVGPLAGHAKEHGRPGQRGRLHHRSARLRRARIRGAPHWPAEPRSSRAASSRCRSRNPIPSPCKSASVHRSLPSHQRDDAHDPADLRLRVDGHHARLHARHRHRSHDREGERRRVPQRDDRAGHRQGKLYPDGIPDAIITISPRSALNLPNGSQKFTITGPDTIVSSPLPNYTWTGTATVTVTGGAVGNHGSGRRRSGDRTGHRDPVRLAVRSQSIHAVVVRAVGADLSADPAQRGAGRIPAGSGFPCPAVRIQPPEWKIQANRGQKRAGPADINTLEARSSPRSSTPEELHLDSQDRQGR